MGTIIDRINDDYESYLELCRLVNENPNDIQKGFFEHQEELLEKYKYEEDGFGFKKK